MKIFCPCAFLDLSLNFEKIGNFQFLLVIFHIVFQKLEVINRAF